MSKYYLEIIYSENAIDMIIDSIYHQKYGFFNDFQIFSRAGVSERLARFLQDHNMIRRVFDHDV